MSHIWPAPANTLAPVSVDRLTGEPFEVLIAGGGVAGLESALSLRDLTGDRVSLRLLAPNREFVYGPMVVQEPFGSARARRYPLSEIAADVGAELIEDGSTESTRRRARPARRQGRSSSTTR